MHIHDSVYGNVELHDSFLIELIQSKPVQRMKGVMQGGVSSLISPTDNATRYEHCVGVMLVLRKNGATVEEQAAGLLHDIGHTAFSHVIDEVFKQYNHNYDDAHLEMVIERSEIPSIFEKFGMDWKKIVQKESFTLLEQPLPRLCADRIDYTLRDGRNFSTAEKREEILQNLTNYEGEFAFKTMNSAKAFISLFNETSKRIWTSLRHGLGYEIMAEALRCALKEGIITEKDLYLTDTDVLKKMKQSSHSTIQKNISLLTPRLQAEIDAEKPDYVHCFKLRTIDPVVWDEKTAKRLSQLEKGKTAPNHPTPAVVWKEIPLRIA